MGLLDILQSEDPAVKQGLLQFGLGLLSSKGNFGNALGNAGMQGLQGVNQYTDRLAQQKRLGLQDQMLQGQVTQQKQAATDQQRQRDFLQGLTSPQMQASQGALAGGGGPTIDNAAKMAPVDQNQQMLFNAMKSGAVPFNDYLASTRKDTAPIKLGAGETLLAPGTFKPLASNPKEQSLPSAVQEYNFAKAQGYGGSFEQWDTSRKKAGASNMNVSVGAEKAFSKDLGAAAAKTLIDSQDAAQAAQGTLANVANVRDALKSGDVILGPGAQARQTGMRAGQVLGVGSKASADTLARTKQVEQGLASLELDASALMKGQGVISESERIILRKIAGGQIQDLTPEELTTALNATERNAKRKIDIHAQRLKQLPEGSVGNLTPFMSTPESGPKIRKFNPATGMIE